MGQATSIQVDTTSTSTSTSSSSRPKLQSTFSFDDDVGLDPNNPLEDPEDDDAAEWEDTFSSSVLSLDGMNILILGQTGVGKTTWVNAYYNYLRYPTLEEAEEGELSYLIPMQITLSNEKYENITIKCGQSSNEVYDDGKSVTKDPSSYDFEVGNQLIRLIDTPGIGDCEGLNRDIENFNCIIKHLQYVRQVHAILILLKPNHARLDVTFKFCLKQLLLNLPRQATKNLVFCFTNTRASNYRPGETLNSLKTLFDESKIDVNLNYSNMYCFDSESVRFLASKSQVNHSRDAQQGFSSSWRVSVQETERLFAHISSLQPISTETVATIKKARDFVQLLQKPIADISLLIQKNVDNGVRILEEINSQNFSGQCDILQAGCIRKLEFKKLQKPRTACINPKCSLGNGSRTTIVCHDECRTWKSTCPCFDWNFNCKNCKCKIGRHISVSFDTVFVAEPNKKLEAQLQLHKSNVEKNKILNEFIQRSILELKREQELILQAGVRFSNFVRTEAMVSYNDAVEEYIKMLMENLKESDKDEMDLITLRELEKTLVAYQREKIREEELFKSANAGGGDDDGENNNKIGGENQIIRSTLDIINIMRQLFTLQHMGKSIRSLVREAKASAREDIFRPKIQTVPLPERQSWSSRLNSLRI